MAKPYSRTRPIVVEFEFSRLASQYLIDAYAQVVPEIRTTPKVQKSNESKHASEKEASS